MKKNNISLEFKQPDNTSTWIDFRIVHRNGYNCLLLASTEPCIDGNYILITFDLITGEIWEYCDNTWVSRSFLTVLNYRFSGSEIEDKRAEISRLYYDVPSAKKEEK